ncbi:MAG: hypothetical protein FJX62_12055 [Alphaproteobacteria bacterium]|nr:hypothetical protein [Alphaproteobacteria bacterium]
MPTKAAAAPAALPTWGLCRKPAGADEPDKFPNVPGGDIFGFTSPTDVGSPGDCGLAFEYSGREGKADGRYWAGTLKTQFSATIAENVAVALSPFVSHHRIRNVTGLDDLERTRFDGISGEVSWRFLERSAANRVAATFSMEPRWARVDGTSGAGVTAYAVEFKLFVDTVLVPDRLYAALNLNYAPATQKADNDPAAGWVRSSSTNVSGALAYQINDRWFVGAEARYLAAFEGSALDRNVGEALFFGPTMMVKLSENAAFNVVWTPQIWGRAAGVDRRLDLDNFERHQFRAKLSLGF